MPRKLRELRADLRRAGFRHLPRRGKGSHTYWEHPADPGARVNLAGADGADAKPYMEQQVRAALARVRRTRREGP